MLVLVVVPIWLAVLTVAYAWGLDPDGPVMVTGYVVAGLMTFFAFLVSADY